MRDLKSIMEVDSTEGILASIEAGLGIGFVSRRAPLRRSLLLDTLKMVPIRGVHLKRQFSLVYSHGPEPTWLPGLFLRHLREETRNAPSPLHVSSKVTARWRKK
jgi:DNA-binding transcriptional LysR family regulator